MKVAEAFKNILSERANPELSLVAKRTKPLPYFKVGYSAELFDVTRTEDNIRLSNHRRIVMVRVNQTDCSTVFLSDEDLEATDWIVCNITDL